MYDDIRQINRNPYICIVSRADVYGSHYKNSAIILCWILVFMITKELYTGGSRLSRIFWEHENLSGLSIIRLIQLL